MSLGLVLFFFKLAFITAHKCFNVLVSNVVVVWWYLNKNQSIQHLNNECLSRFTNATAKDKTATATTTKKTDGGQIGGGSVV